VWVLKRATKGGIGAENAFLFGNMKVFGGGGRNENGGTGRRDAYPTLPLRLLAESLRSSAKSAYQMRCDVDGQGIFTALKFRVSVKSASHVVAHSTNQGKAANPTNIPIAQLR
jgi:hypothetical protein